MSNQKKVLLLGETCQDKFIYGRCDRVCPEAPALIFNSISETKSSKGMCFNVKKNMSSLSNNSLQIYLVTNQSSIKKTRLIDTSHNQIIMRIDENDHSNRIDMDAVPDETFDAVVISDYNKGFLENEDLDKIGSRFNCLKIIDTKKIIKSWGTHFDYIKVNESEWFANLSEHGSSESILKNSKCILKTVAEEGCFVINNSGSKKIPSFSVKIGNVSGAGDTFLSAFAVKLLEGDSLYNSVSFANKCAAIAVSKENVSVVRRKEVEDFFTDSRDIR